MGDPQAALGHGLMRDNYGPRALETLVRYRGTVLAELFRALGALKPSRPKCSLRSTQPYPHRTRRPPETERT